MKQLFLGIALLTASVCAQASLIHEFSWTVDDVFTYSGVGTLIFDQPVGFKQNLVSCTQTLTIDGNSVELGECTPSDNFFYAIDDNWILTIVDFASVDWGPVAFPFLSPPGLSVTANCSTGSLLTAGSFKSCGAEISLLPSDPNLASAEVGPVDFVPLHEVHVAEPTTLALLGLGIVGLGCARKRRA